MTKLINYQNNQKRIIYNLFFVQNYFSDDKFLVFPHTTISKLKDIHYKIIISFLKKTPLNLFFIIHGI